MPALPEEKPFTGKIDEAYGAFPARVLPDGDRPCLAAGQVGHPAAQTLVAAILEQGLGVARDAKAARSGTARRRTMGDPAHVQICLILMGGRYVKRDRKKADELMKKAADLGKRLGQFNYGQTLVADMAGRAGG